MNREKNRFDAKTSLLSRQQRDIAIDSGKEMARSLFLTGLLEEFEAPMLIDVEAFNSDDLDDLNIDCARAKIGHVGERVLRAFCRIELVAARSEYRRIVKACKDVFGDPNWLKESAQ